MSVSTRSVAFVGFMGAGKTTAARALVERRPDGRAYDVDEEIVRRTGRPIEEIFATDGERGFRELEEQMTLELLSGGGRAVSLGGGAMHSTRIREALARHLVVWIDVDVDTAWRRASAAAGRWRVTARGSPRCTPPASRCTRRLPT